MAVMRRRAGRRTPAGFVSLRNPNKVIFLQIRMRIVVDVSMKHRVGAVAPLL